MTSSTAVETGDRVRVVSTLNDGRYVGRLATVVEVYSTGETVHVKGSHVFKEARPDRFKVRIQLDRWSRMWEAPDGVLYLELGEVEHA